MMLAIFLQFGPGKSEQICTKVSLSWKCLCKIVTETELVEPSCALGRLELDLVHL